MTSTRSTYPRPFKSLRKNLVAALVSPGGDQNVQHSPVLVNHPPQIVGLALDRDDHLVKMPRVTGAESPAVESVGVGLPELGAPSPHRFVGDHDPALEHHLFNVTQAQWETVVQPHAVADDLHREPEPHIRRHASDHPPQPLPTLSNQSITSAAASSTKLTMPQGTPGQQATEHAGRAHPAVRRVRHGSAGRAPDPVTDLPNSNECPDPNLVGRGILVGTRY